MTTRRLPRLDRRAAWAALAAGLRAARPAEAIGVSEWAERHYVCSTQAGAQPGQWRCAPFQRGILDMAFAHPDVRTVTVIKSARVGYSTMLRIFLAYCLAHEPRQPLLYLPTGTDAVNTMRMHIEATIRCVEPLSALCDVDARGKHNREDRKHFGNGMVLHVLGGKAARNYREHTKDVVIYDELDGFDRNIEGEGAPTALGDARVTNSPWRKSIRGSTPTVEAISQIDESAQSADARFRRHLPCPACGTLQPLTWGQIKWDDRDASTVRHECAACAHPARHRDLAGMDATGRWTADDGTWIDEEAGVYRDADDAEVTAPEHAAFHVWAAYSPFMPWRELVREHYKALEASRHGDHTQRQSFTNLRLGETWSQPGTEVAPGWLQARVETYTAVPDAVEAIVAGVDVQQDRLEAEVLGMGPDNETWSLAYRVFYGDTRRPDTWEQLDALLAEQWLREDGTAMLIHAMGVDEGYNTDTVRAFAAARMQRRVFALKGYAGFSRLAVQKGRKHPIATLSGVKCTVHPLGVDVLKALVYQSLLVSAPGPGYQHFPASYGPDYFEGLTAEKLVTKNRRGQPVQQWVRVRPRNEPLDCRVYALAAWRIANPRAQATAKVMRPAAVRVPVPAKTPGEAPPPPVHVSQAAGVTRRRRRRKRPADGFRGADTDHLRGRW